MDLFFTTSLPSCLIWRQPLN